MIRLATLFFLSGAVGLAYEVVWTRALGDVVGSTALSSSAVFSVFLAGLALGAAWFGRRARGGAQALRLYGLLELSVGLTAGLGSYVLLSQRGPLAALGPHGSGIGAELLFAVAGSALLIGLPSFLMGGTLPVLIQAAAGRWEARTVAPLLYGWNTVGAAVGALSAGFVLIWRLGFSGTVAVGVAVNLVVGLLAVLWAGRWGAEPIGSAPADELQHGPGDDDSDRGWLLLAFFSGFQILALEVLWGRVARFILGDRTMAISALLFVFVLSLGLASLLTPAVGRWLKATSRRGVLVGIGLVLLFGGLLNIVAIPLGAELVSGGGLFALTGRGIGERLVLVALLLGPSTLVLGLIFPLLIWSAREIGSRPGRVVGRLYLVNTAGAVLGSWAAAFALAGLLGTLGGLKLLTLSGLVLSAVLLFRSRSGRAGLAGAGLAAVAALAVLFVPGSLVTLLDDETLVAAEEDEYGVQVLARTERGTFRVRNNRLSLIFDLGDPATDHAQQMAAHWSMLLTESPSRILNIGTGYGITAGAFTLYDSAERLETIEILPFLVDQLDRFQDHNFRLVADPRVEIRTGDGRAFLTSSEERWDVLSVNVLDPYLPGSASLYTTDFWRAARDRLNPGGVFTQLFWGEDVDLLVRGLNEVFPTVLYFRAYGNTSYNVLAFAELLEPDDLALRLNRLTELGADEIRRLEGGAPEEVLPALLTEAWRLRDEMNRVAAANSGPLHTDDRPVLEYRWANGAPGVSAFDSPLVVY